jgi:cytochrome P450
MLRSLIAALRIRLAMAVAAGAALAVLAVRVVSALPASDRAARLAALLAATDMQRRVFAVLRAVAPNLVLRRRLIAAYESTGTAIVTRHADVTEVLEREADFAVVYEPRMRAITDGENFFLGMQDSAAYARDVSAMRLAVRRDDVAERVVPPVASRAAAIVAAAPGRIDVPADLTLPVLAHLVGAYFGTPGPTPRDLTEGTTLMFWWLFADLAADPALAPRALDAAAATRAWLDAAIAARQATPTEDDDVLNRCLALQRAGTPGMDDLGIRNNLIGLLIGLVPTLSKASVLALAQLLDRPDALAGAQAAARSGDDAAVAAHVFEALRFDPVNPIIYRRALADTEIARGTLRARRIPAGTMVLAANLSAMFDALAVEAPESFRTDRPWRDYMLWGYGMHACFGAQINRAVIPQMLKPLLMQPGLRRAEGAAGRVDGGGTPFPQHFTVAWGTR